ncbi:MAG: FeoA domain-containing protein, partial [Planctomycetes bacterium]|nr:FeoA domain-containing protein [Planctomycetota bacterium]
MHDLIPLTQIATGAKGKVAQVVGTPSAVHRLEEMGLRDGVAVEIVKSGTPC